MFSKDPIKLEILKMSGITNIETDEADINQEMDRNKFDSYEDLAVDLAMTKSKQEMSAIEEANKKSVLNCDELRDPKTKPPPVDITVSAYSVCSIEDKKESPTKSLLEKAMDKEHAVKMLTQLRDVGSHKVSTAMDIGFLMERIKPEKQKPKMRQIVVTSTINFDKE